MLAWQALYQQNHLPSSIDCFKGRLSRLWTSKFLNTVAQWFPDQVVSGIHLQKKDAQATPSYMSVWGVSPRLNCVWYFLGSLGIHDCELAKKPQDWVENFLRGGSSCHLADNLVSRYPRKVACSTTSHWPYQQCEACRGAEVSARLKSLWSQMLKSKSVCVCVCVHASRRVFGSSQTHIPTLSDFGH